MSSVGSENRLPNIGEIVDAYEEARSNGSEADLASFAPADDHPEFLAIVCELVRVDLEYQWERGHQLRLEAYSDKFPKLFESHELVNVMAYEEFRLRLQAGQAATTSEYASRFGIDASLWPSQGQAAPSPVVQASDSRLSYLRSQSDAIPRRSGQLDVLESLSDLYAQPGAYADLVRSLDRANPHLAERLSQAIGRLPQVGGDFLGFHLTEELGRGAFGRVFLAKQGELADRPVVLKVSADIAGESHALARLQHTNVVPIYSVHRKGSLHAVCMPYLGSTTLADTLTSVRSHAALPKSGDGLVSSIRVRPKSTSIKSRPPSATLDASPGQTETSVDESSTPNRGTDLSGASKEVSRLRGLGYVPAVLWIVGRVAEGLAHAHDRGILHRDLKPANILFSDDGEPILLDFNLAADTHAETNAALALVGGTLPYMAPENLLAFLDHKLSVDPRSDVYALGVILYELLTANHPFPLRKGDVDDILPLMIEDRNRPLPDLRKSNPAISPAVAAIVEHCLAPDPNKRYASARELQEDIHRQLNHLPLRHARDRSIKERTSKWMKRHPRLTSASTVALVSTALLITTAWALLTNYRQNQFNVAQDVFRKTEQAWRESVALQTISDSDAALINESIEVCETAALRFDADRRRDWFTRSPADLVNEEQHRQLRSDMGDLFVHWSLALTKRASTLPPKARARDLREAKARLNSASFSYGQENLPKAYFQASAELFRVEGRPESDIALQIEAAQLAPFRNDREQLLVDPKDLTPEMLGKVQAELETYLASNPRDFASWLSFGNWNRRLGHNDNAIAAYHMSVALSPKLFWTRFNRASYYLERESWQAAINDLNLVLEAQPDFAAALVNRAIAKFNLDDAKGAKADLDHVLSLKDAPTRAWFIRAKVRTKLGDLAGAKQDRDEGIKHQPSDPESYVMRGLARLATDLKGGLSDFDAALAIDPTYIHALQDKASVLSEGLKQPEQAIKTLDLAISAHPTSVDALSGRAVLLARLGRRDEAINGIKAALEIETRPIILYQAACVYALTSRKQSSDSATALAYLAKSIARDASLLRVAPTDPDLAPIQASALYQQLLKALETVTQVAQPR
jgi:serine/threonine protein kinase/Flp pilus assembly protein TadD